MYALYSNLHHNTLIFSKMYQFTSEHVFIFAASENKPFVNQPSCLKSLTLKQQPTTSNPKEP